MEGGVDENYNFKSSSSISTNHNSRPRSTYLTQKKGGSRMIKTMQSRSVSPNTFQPLYLEQKCVNTKNTYTLKKRDLSNKQLNDVMEVNQSLEIRNSINSQKDKLQQKRPASTNTLARICQNGNLIEGQNSKQNNLSKELNTQSKDGISTNNSYYNQFYNVSKILNKTENNLDISSFLDITNTSVKNGQNLNRTQASASTNNYFNNAPFDSNDISQFNSNQKSQNKSRILTENRDNSNSELPRSMSRISSRNATGYKNNRKIVLSNSKSAANKLSNDILIQEEGKLRDSQLSLDYEDINYANEKSGEKKEEQENKEEEDNIHHIKKEYMDEKEVKNISYYINNMMYEDFKVYTDAQLLSKMDRESLIIRLQLLEQENKEIKCHNLHLSSKFKGNNPLISF